MSPTQSEATTLDNHAALACRLIRTQNTWKPYYTWLARPTLQISLPHVPNPRITESLELLLAPLRSGCSDSEQRETQSANQWLALLCQLVACGRNKQTWQIHLLAAGLLPLYRALATGRLREGFLQCRRRLSESLCLFGVIDHLCLDELFEITVNALVSPHRILREQIQIDLTRLNYLVAAALPSYEVAENRFRSGAEQILWGFNPDQKLSADYQTPDWADPQTLWVLSNELLSSRSDFVLPRSWIDTPVQWGKIIEHWHRLELNLIQDSQKEKRSPAATVKLSSSSQAWPSADSTVTETQSALDLSDYEPVSPVDELRDTLQASLQEMEVMDQAISTELDERLEIVTDLAEERALVQKVVIGEILGLDDPAFHNVVKRHVAVCRIESRAICLSMIIVVPDSDSITRSNLSEQEFGHNRWQQKMVNWLAEHPSIKDPVTFVTGEGQLIVTVMDIERNEMTAILRQGLVEVLTGARGQGATNSLCQVNVPARFHVGIASTSAPSASFNPKELIHSAHRCLTVAQRLGKASIKSIEVY